MGHCVDGTKEVLAIPRATLCGEEAHVPPWLDLLLLKVVQQLLAVEGISKGMEGSGARGTHNCLVICSSADQPQDFSELHIGGMAGSRESAIK